MDAVKMQKIMKSLERSFAAASFAEEGESRAAASVMAEGRRVLLAIKQGETDAKTLKYALNTARRIGAQLDIVMVSSGAAPKDDPLLDGFLRDLREAEVLHKVVRKSGCLKQVIIDYTETEKEILFAVIESPHSLDADCNKRDKTLADLWRQLKCPLVVVMDQAKA
jgi:hypothetical protein